MLFTFTREVCHANCSGFAHAPWFLGVVALGVHRPDASWLLGMVAAWPCHSRLHHLEFANGMLESLRRWPLSQRGPLGPIHGPLAVKDGAHAGQNGSRARTHGARRRRLVGTSPIEWQPCVRRLSYRNAAAPRGRAARIQAVSG